jgi:tRNA-splicing ligase RtcB (3'-phosphate/5'-hydroxy nucleic acid ligase)
MVGVDIGCGMLVLKVSRDFKMDLPKLDKIINEKIPSGMKHRPTLHPFAKDFKRLNDLIANTGKDTLLYSIGTLGGGNHFIEVDKDELGYYYIVIHSGSRHLGIEVADYWTKKAVTYHQANSKTKSELIAKLKAEGREKDIQAELAKIPNVVVSKDLSYLESEDLKGYLHDMDIAQDYAKLNREAILNVICSEMGINNNVILDKFCTIHNYIDTKNKILRKGAISLQTAETAIIPMNMRDGSLIVKGKGNFDWNCSGPHGAGRLMSRAAAKRDLKMDDFTASMKGIYTTSVCAATIDEAPMAYKPMEEIVANIDDNADIINIIKPIYNFKAKD